MFFSLFALSKLQTWMDYRLTWNVSELDGLDVIYIPVTKMWTPDVTLYNK